jgi:flagellar secretion chaperone FliS
MQTPHDAYLTAHVMTASPARLRWLLIDGALKFARQASEGWKAGQFEPAALAIDRCRGIVTELMTTPNAELAPELARQVSGLYSFVFRTLNEASLAHDARKLADVVRLLEIERETWRIVSEQTTGAAPAAQPPAGRPRGPAAPATIPAPHRAATQAAPRGVTSGGYPPSAFSVEA